MSRPKLPPDFVKLCQTVTAKRPRTVINHILKHGFITTQELKDKYGYNHPPRAHLDGRGGRDLREAKAKDYPASEKYSGLRQGNRGATSPVHRIALMRPLGMRVS